MKEIKLSKQGKNKGLYVALVDDDDFEYLNQFRWCVNYSKNKAYAYRSISKMICEKMHNVIMGRKWVDHIDHNGLNNQKSNLRLCTNQQNQMNQRPHRNSFSSLKGVDWCKANNKWRARIKVNGIRNHIGYYKDEIEAAKAYDMAAQKHYKEFAHLNFKTN